MQGALEFKTEIKLLSRVHRMNLMRLVSFCYDNGNQMLIYDYNQSISQLINVMRKLCLQTSQEHSLRTAIFFTYIKIANDFYKVIIDSGSSVNAISEKALKQLGLPFEKHPTPYEVSWVINSSLPLDKMM